MSYQSASRIMANIRDLPPSKQRHYLILSLQCKKVKGRKELAKALRTITTKTLRGHHDRP